MNPKVAPFTCTHTANLPQILHQLNCSLAISTYQAGKVVLVSALNRERLIQLPRSFQKPMGIAADRSRLAIATRTEVIVFNNASRMAATYPQQPHTYDALYLPRATYFTGEVDIHDLHWSGDHLIGVNTRFSCLSLIDHRFSFIPQWKPFFISRISRDDQCHLNGKKEFVVSLNGFARGMDRAGDYLFITTKSGADNPIDAVSTYNTSGTPFLNFTDIDHDGDLDLFFGSAGKYHPEGSALILVENTGSSSAPVFTTFHHGLFHNVDNDRPQPDFVGYDRDGDLDTFIGNSNGTVSYLENTNPVVVTTVSGSILDYEPGDGPVVVDPGLTLTDPDNDFIIQATVAIEDFQGDEVLAFTLQPGINGLFDSATGILTFTGKATVAEYQAVLRTVTFEVVAAAASRKMPSENTLIDRTITFNVYDQDFTVPLAASKSIEIFVNDPPIINNQTIDLTVGGSATFDLKTLISDPNGVTDLDLSSLQVIEQPGSGAATSIDANGMLAVDYSALTFLGTETMALEVCDVSGACAQSTLSLTVGNTAPLVAAEEFSTIAGTFLTINLTALTSDADGNLDPAGFSIVQGPGSGATATLETVSSTEVNLIIDYNGLTFVGEDQLIIRACDHAGACTEGTLIVNVTNSPPVIDPAPLMSQPGTVKSINLMSITSDPDDNLDPEAFAIVQAPASGAAAMIKAVSSSEVNLLLDYEDITFNGNDAVAVRTCDRAGACTESVLSVEVDVADGGIIVYNAVAPNSSGNNRFMRITGLPEENRVSIFNRWGDKVYDVENYQNSAEGNAFRGTNSGGNALPTGTYFYTIEIPGRKTVSGYLTLIQ